MEQSSGRTEAPTTEAGGPDAPALDEIHYRVRDVPPAGAYDDPMAAGDRTRTVDPLDPSLPGRDRDDPLDPGGHVI